MKGIFGWYFPVYSLLLFPDKQISWMYNSFWLIISPPQKHLTSLFLKKKKYASTSSSKYIYTEEDVFKMLEYLIGNIMLIDCIHFSTNGWHSNGNKLCSFTSWHIPSLLWRCFYRKSYLKEGTLFSLILWSKLPQYRWGIIVEQS